MKLEKGMKVRVKSRKEAIDTYGLTNYQKINMPYSYMPTEMDPWLNKVVTIKNVNGESINLKEVRYNWHKDMFKPRVLLSFKNLREN